MRHMHWYTAYWILWLSAFLAVEGWALVAHMTGATFSDAVWTWFGVTGRQRQRRRWTPWEITRRVVLGEFMLWLGLHMEFGWFTLSHPLPWR